MKRKNVRDRKVYIKDKDLVIRISQPCHIKINYLAELGTGNFTHQFVSTGLLLKLNLENLD
jgi:hypothetical protein